MCAGCNPVAPHGTCNTGILLFDNVAFNIFKRSVLSLLQYSTLNTHDRFLDSLLFVGAINNQHTQNAFMNADGGELSVDIWPFKFNFMAFFEIEMEELRQQEQAAPDVHEVVFGHFLTDTYLSCFLGEDGLMVNDNSPTAKPESSKEDCNCMYYNSRLPGQSLLHAAIRRSVSPNCKVFAGKLLKLAVLNCVWCLCCMYERRCVYLNNTKLL